jgi:predicted transcriptional regulator
MAGILESQLSLEETLREAIRGSGLSENALAREAGVPQPVIWRFMRGKATMRLPNVERLMVYFDIEVRRR